MRKRLFSRAAAGAAALAISIMTFSALADEDDGARPDVEVDLQHDEAQRALKSGLVRPLEDILKEVRSKFPGDIIEIEFEKDDGVYVYEIELIRPDGRMVEIKVDAKTAAVLEMDDD